MSLLVDSFFVFKRTYNLDVVKGNSTFNDTGDRTAQRLYNMAF
jgi:hypothetical protein